MKCPCIVLSTKTGPQNAPNKCKALPLKRFNSISLYSCSVYEQHHAFDFTTYLNVSIISQFYSLSLAGPSSILLSKPPPSFKFHSKQHILSGMSFLAQNKVLTPYKGLQGPLRPSLSTTSWPLQLHFLRLSFLLIHTRNYIGVLPSLLLSCFLYCTGPGHFWQNFVILAPTHKILWEKMLNFILREGQIKSQMG